MRHTYEGAFGCTTSWFSQFPETHLPTHANCLIVMILIYIVVYRRMNKNPAGIPTLWPWAQAPCETAISLPGPPPLQPCQIPTWLGAPCLGQCHNPGPHWIHALPGSLPLRPPGPQDLLGPRSVWENWRNTTPGSPPIGPGISSV
jgi:hypothetical protein